jgi:MFS family permease
MSWREGSLRSLKYRNFRLFFLANLLSNTGTWAQRVAQDWLVVTDLHRGGSALGVVTGLQFLPMMLLSLYAGSLADRFDKRKLLILTNAGGGITAAVLGWLIIAHKVTILEVFILAFALGLFGALDTPVRQSFTSELVGTSDISNAVSLNSANFNLGRLIGPAISGILIKYFHTGPSFLLNAGTFSIVIISLVLMRPKDLNRLPKSDKDRKIAEGIHYIRGRVDLVAIITTVFFASTFGLNFQIFNTLISTKIFHKDAGAFGLLGSILAIGSLLAAIVSARLDHGRKPIFIIRSAMLFGIALIVQALMPTYLAFSIWLPVCGFLALTTMISRIARTRNGLLHFDISRSNADRLSSYRLACRRCGGSTDHSDLWGGYDSWSALHLLPHAKEALRLEGSCIRFCEESVQFVLICSVLSDN